MSKTAAQIDALIAHADELYNNADATRQDLKQAERIYLDALDFKLEQEGPDAFIMGMLHNALGMVYGKMHDNFDEGEAHYSAATKIFTDPTNQVIALNNHAILLVKKGTQLLEESEELEEDLEDSSTTSRTPRIGSTPESRGLGALLTRTAGKNRDREMEALTAESEALQEEVQTLRLLSSTNADATNCFKRADSLRLRALTIMQKHAKKQADAIDKAKAIAADAKKGKPSTSTALVVHKGGKNGIVQQSPAAIMAALDGTAIGQKAAKRGLANAASQHLKRMAMSPEDRAKTDKANVLILGPTGCGKTLLVSDLARILGVPCYRSDATKLTASGYVGEDVQSLLEGLLRDCDYDVELAQNGIIYVDEIDKIRRVDGNGLDVGGESVQQELLTILEGTIIQVTGKSGKRDDKIDIDTTNILFICGGAFPGLGDIVARRIQDNGTTIGFGASLQDKKKDNSIHQRSAAAEDFKAYGMIAEFIGRLPKRLYVEKLTLEQLERILVEPEKALTKQKRLITAGTTDLRFTRGAITAIAEEALKAGTNGRALSEIMEAVMEPIIFDQPKVAIVTADMVKNRNQEIGAQADMEDPRKALPDYIIDDDAVESTLEEATRRRDNDRSLPVVQRGRRDLAVVKGK
jgi:ATP-dependent Clp protease ATP-binding subunit ClpX